MKKRKKSLLIFILTIVSIYTFSNKIKVNAETTESTENDYKKISYLYLDIIDSKYFNAETCKNDTACPFKIESDGSYKIISTLNNPYNIDADGISLEVRTQWSANYVKKFFRRI